MLWHWNTYSHKHFYLNDLLPEDRLWWIHSMWNAMMMSRPKLWTWREDFVYSVTRHKARMRNPRIPYRCRYLNRLDVMKNIKRRMTDRKYKACQQKIARLYT